MKSGEKNNTRRRLDRDYRTGDTVEICEWLPVDNMYSGDEMHYIITHIAYGGKFGLATGFCILSLKRIDHR